jgi:diguanylate cyclase (GGDEF)-like protein
MSLSDAFAEKLEQRRKGRAPDPETPRQGSAPAERPCVLVIDDEVEITASVAALLEGEYRVITAQSADEGLALLKDNSVAVILTDQRMPGGAGSELLARSLDIAPEASRILFTGYSDITAVIDAVNEGQVYRYITKPWQPDELRAVLNDGLDRHRLVVENRRLINELTEANATLERRVEERTQRLRSQNQALREAHDRIEQLSRKDALTELTNRRWLDEILHGEAERARRYDVPFCVVMIDLDHFKDVNDTFGHAVGDQVLIAVARALESSARMSDVVARYGGEEFLALLPNSAVEQAWVLAERMRAGVRGIPLPFRSEPMTASFGVAQWRPDDTVAGLVDRADEALYRAKRAGRDRVEGSRQEAGPHE